MSLRDVLVVPGQFKHAIKPPFIEDYPKQTKDLLKWAAFHSRDPIPDSIEDGGQFSQKASNRAGRLDLLERNTSRNTWIESWLLKEVKMPIKKNPESIVKMVVSLFLTQIPQFFVMNFFSSLDQYGILEDVEYDGYAFEVKFKGRKALVPLFEVIETGMDALGIKLNRNHHINYCEYLLNWSIYLGLMKSRKDKITSSPDSYNVITKPNLTGHFHSIDLTDNGLSALKTSLLKLARGATKAGRGR